MAIAFVQGDVGMLRWLTREDVVLTLVDPRRSPGHIMVATLSPVSRSGSGGTVTCSSHVIRFAHDGDRMTAHRDIAISGHLHRVEMTLLISFSFDRSDRISAVQIEPSDPGLFDHVISVEMGDERVRGRSGSQICLRTSTSGGRPRRPATRRPPSPKPPLTSSTPGGL